jgi:outer membrane lipoprotein-sorting protein
MSPTTRRRLPWAAPVAAGAVVALAAVVPQAFAADPHPTLPSRTATQLIADASSDQVSTLSGTVRSTPDLGLPQLPGSDGGNLLTTLATEPATWRLWIGGDNQQRLSLLGTGQETDLVRDGTSVWTWDSSTQAATHYLLPAEGAHTDGPAAAEPSPTTLARRLLRHLSPSTAVSVGATTRVAGRPAYTLVLSPRTSRTLIGRVVIDVDAATGTPLGVQLAPRGSSAPALTEQFTAVDFTAPAASTFRFSPPAGATVTTHRVSGHQQHGRQAGAAEATPQVIGGGWAGVAAVATGASSLAGSPSATSNDRHSLSGILAQATNPAPGGARVLQTRLLSVLFERDGTVLAGAVPASRLEQVAQARR